MCMNFCWFMQVKHFSPEEKSVRAPLCAAQHITAHQVRVRKPDLEVSFQSVPRRTKPNCTAQWKWSLSVSPKIRTILVRVKSGNAVLWKGRLICRLFLRIIISSVTGQKSGEDVHLNVPEPNVTSSNCIFCPNNSPAHKTPPLLSWMTQKSSKSSHLRG